MKARDIKKAVRKGYAKVAKKTSSCCTPEQSCCETQSQPQLKSQEMDYTEHDIKSVPEGSHLSLGCGNPVAIASLKKGETVLDLGSGAGFDCFLAANKVGKGGKVIGVDMTPEMIEKARDNAEKGNYENVEFRLGEIEHLPAADNSVDTVISNCVINLSPEKEKVLREAYRVLKPGGTIAISDLALLKELPEKIRNSKEAYIGCVAGAIPVKEYENAVKAVGFKNVRVTRNNSSSCADSETNDPVIKATTSCLGDKESIGEYVVSVYIEAHK
jgi:SAM-dependent methyltransferase